MKCTRCNLEIFTPNSQDNLPYLPPIIPCYNGIVYYSGKPYHAECINGTSAASVIKHNVEINLNVTLKLTETLPLINVLMQSSDKICKHTALRLAKILCEHENEYLMCASCSKLIMRKDAIVGEKTKAYQEILVKQSETVNPADSPVYTQNGKAHRVVYFCSQFCDGNFSSRIHLKLEHEVQEVKRKVEDLKETFVKSIQNVKEKGVTGKELEQYTEAYQKTLKRKIENEVLEAKKLIVKTTKELIG